VWSGLRSIFLPGGFQSLFYTLLHTLQLKHSMFFLCLIVSYFVGNGFTVDDLGLLLVMVAVIILFMMVTIFRAARLLVWMIIPIEYRNELIRRNLNGGEV